MAQLCAVVAAAPRHHSRSLRHVPARSAHPAPSCLTGRHSRQALVATAAVAAFLRVGAVAVASAPLPERSWLHRGALAGLGLVWQGRMGVTIQHPPLAALPAPGVPGCCRDPHVPGCLRPRPGVGFSRQLPGAAGAGEAACAAPGVGRQGDNYGTQARHRAPSRPRRVLTLRRLQAGRAAAQRAALLRSQAVLVLQAGEGAGGNEPLRGCCRAGTGLLCSAEGPRGEAALQCPRAAPGNLPLPDPSASSWLDPFLCPIPKPSAHPSGGQEAASSAQGAAPQQWGLHREWDREKGASCPGTEVVSAAVPRCRTFCRGDAAQPALPGAALEPSGAAGVVGTEWGLQAQAAHEVPWTPPRFLGVPCGGMAMSGQCQSPSSSIPGEAGCGSLWRGQGTGAGTAGPRAGDFSASWPGAAGPPHRDLHGTAQCGTVSWHSMVWHGTGPCVPLQGSKCHGECHWPCQGEASTKPAPAGGQDLFLSILLPQASSLQAAHSSLLLSPPLPSSPPPRPGTPCSSWSCWENWDSPASGTAELRLAPVPGSCCQLRLRREPPLPRARPAAAGPGVWAANRRCRSFTANSSCLVQTKRHRLWSRCGQSHAPAGHHRSRHRPTAGCWQQGCVPRMQPRPCCKWYPWELTVFAPVGCRGCPRG